MRRVTIFGSTGSIGCNTVELIAADPDAYDVVALTGGRNIARLAEQARALNADIAVTAHEDGLSDLRAALDGTGIEVAAGEAALCEVATRPADWIMSAIVGAAGLPPGLKALEQGTTLALANKESLVTAGPLLMQTARDHGATILPVDSEHSAVFQALVGEDIDAIEKVTITSSGGAFRDWPLDKLKDATVAEASTHPNFDMGQRITIDSATMFNKALELIEAKELFGLAPDEIEPLIHRQQIIHAMVSFVDGGTMAHMGDPDMRHAIGYSLNWPARKRLPVDRVDWTTLGGLTFETPDPARYPALAIAQDVMAEGGLSGAVFNGAKERALDHFIDGRLGFLDMARVVRMVFEKMSTGGLGTAPITLDTVREADHLARTYAAEASAAL